MKLAVKVLWISLAWLLGWTLFYLLNLQTAYSADLPGKKVFLDSKCNQCHAVKDQGIAKTETPKSEEDEAEEEEEKVDPPDLSEVCNGIVKSKIDWPKDLDGWVQKTVLNSDGKKHKKSYKGTPENRKMLVDWLLTLCKSPSK